MDRDSDLQSLLDERGSKIHVLEGKLRDAHETISLLESRLDVRGKELEKLKVRFSSVCERNAILELLLEEERHKSLWERIFGR